MELAYDQPTYSIYAIVSEKYSADKEHPIHVTDVDKTAEELAKIIDADPEDLKERLQKGIDKGLWQVEFGSAGSGLSQDQKKRSKLWIYQASSLRKKLSAFIQTGRLPPRSSALPSERWSHHRDDRN